MARQWNFLLGFLAELSVEARPGGRLSRRKRLPYIGVLKKLDDIVGGVRFTIRTDHRNLLHLNNHGSRKVLQ